MGEPASVKGVGKLGITGATATIINAVFNAIGRRVTCLPVRPETLV